MSSQLLSFLNKRRVRKGEPFTHGSMIAPRGSFYIKSDEDIEKFWTLYCNNLAKGEEVVGLTEKPEKFGPLRIDFDFKFPLEIGTRRRYTKQHVEDVIYAYQHILKSIIDLSEFEERMLYCILLEKPEPRVDNGYIKDGFHLHFPHFITNEFVQNVYIRNKIMEIIENDGKFENFRKNVISHVVDQSNQKLTIAQQLNNVIDPIFTKNWLMYGSIKSENTEAWKITEYYDDELKIITLNEMFNRELDYIFQTLEKRNKPTYYLPRLMSIRPHLFDEETLLTDKITQDIIKRQQEKRQRKKANIKTNRSMEDVYKDLKVIDDGQLMSMLGDYRADNYDEWMNVGWTLFNIGQGCDKTLDMWIEFSKRSEKYKEGECEEKWEKMELGGKTIASLMFMARNDNPDRYFQWREDQLDYLIEKAVSHPKPTHYSIVEVMHKMYEHRFICASSKNDKWYEFYNHRWHEIDNGISILKLIPTEVQSKFMEYVNKLTYDIQRDDIEDILKERLQKRRDRAYKIMTELENQGFMEKILKMCKIKFYDSSFLKKMDENRNLICFENGVYDLKQGIFRSGCPDDYITFSTGTNYYEYSPHDEEILELEEYLHKVFVNPKIRNYFLDFVCSCLQGGNRNKVFVVFTGPKDAGKSAIVKLLQKIMGDYSMDFPRETFIVGPKSSAGGARPDLARVRGKRMAFAKEITKEEKLNIGMVKEMTGNDSFYARGLWEKGNDITPMFTMVLMCNEPPSMPAHDDAAWGRIRVIPFESRFLKDKSQIPDDPEEQFSKKIFDQDPHFEEKLDRFVGSLTWILIQRFKNYIKNGISEPEEVTISTYQYKLSNDVFMQFVEENIEQTDDSTQFLRLNDLFSDFKSWYIENYPSYAKEKVGKNQFKIEMSKRLAPIASDGKWYGFKQKTPLDDDTIEIDISSVDDDPIAENYAEQTFEL